MLQTISYYMANHPGCYYKSDMILNVHSDVSYLSASDAHSKAAGVFFLSSLPKNNKPIRLNSAIHVLCTMLKFVATSAAEAELGLLFLNAKEAKRMRLTLDKLGYPCQSTRISSGSDNMGSKMSSGKLAMKEQHKEMAKMIDLYKEITATVTII